MVNTGIRRAFVSIMASAAMASALPGTAQAQDAPRTHFNIPAQDLGSALTDLARQSNHEIYFSSELTRGKRAKPIQGELTVQTALQQLLAGSGLTYKLNSSGAIVIDRDLGNAFAGDEAGDDRPKIAEILVVGQRNQTLNADIRRTEDDPQPYVVLGREEIERSGATNVEDFLRKRLPQNNVPPGFASLGGSSLQTPSPLDLRGLPGQTLVLVNGRRVAGVTVRGSEGQFNLNGIPLSAIERIEVLPTTASGIYGGSATGGVINVILRRDYRGFDLSASYGNSFAGGSGHYRIDGSGGFALEDGRTTVMFAGSYEHRSPLLRGERSFLADYLAELYQVAPQGATGTIFGSTPNIRSLTGANLVLDNGTNLGSSFTSVPTDYAGPSTDGGAALAANAGRYNLLPTDNALFRNNRDTVFGGSEIISAMGNIQREFGSEVKAFLDMAWSRQRNWSPSAGSPVIVVPAAVNPFQQDVIVTVPTSSIDDVFKGQFTDLRLTAGVIFDLPSRWRGEFDYGWDRNRSEGTSVRSFNGTAAAAAVSSGALSIFRDTVAFPVDLSPYLGVGPGNIHYPSDTTLTNATLRLGGPVGRLPGGEPQVTALLETRNTKRDENVWFFDIPSANLVQTTFYPERSQRVRSAYGEVRLPILSPENHVPLFDTLELQLSVRHDDYTSNGVSGSVIWFDRPDNPPNPFPAVSHATNKVRSTDFTAALKWKPIEDLALRASYGTGFLPPSVDQLITVSNQFTAGAGIIDPLRGGQFASGGTILSGGNAGLKPEQSKSWSVGAILEPRFLPGFRLSVDYLNIRKTDNIASFPGGSNSLVAANAQDGSFADRIQRGPNLPGDPVGFAGPITFIDNTLFNLATAKIEAVDAQLDYKFTTDVGEFSLFALGSYQPTYKTQVFDTTPVIENVGFSGGPTKYKGNMGLDWSHDRWAAGWAMSYYHSYLVYGPGLSAATIAPFATRNHGPDLRIPSQSYHDLYLSYRLGDVGQLLSQTKLQLNISNVLNKKPPRERDRNSGYGDPRLARYVLTLSTHF